MMRKVRAVLLIILVVGASFFSGNYFGRRVGEEKMQSTLAEREVALKAVDLHKALGTLLTVREQPDQLAPDLEGWIKYRLGTIDLDSVSPNSFAVPALREAANRLVEYRTKYPGTTIDPANDAKVQKFLSFARPSAISPPN